MKRLSEAEAAAAFTRAAKHFEAGEFEPAAVLCRQLQASFPKHPGILGLYGLVQLRRGRAEEALEKLRRAVKLAPADVGLQANLTAAQRELRGGNAAAAAREAERGWALLPQGRDEEALAAFESWTVLAPTSAAAHDAVGQALQKLRRWHEAVAAHRRAAALAPEDGAVLLDLATALSRGGGGADEAETLLRRAAATPAVADAAEANLANLVLRARGDEDEALALFERVLARSPSHQGASIGAGWLRLARGEFARGFALFEARFGQDALGRGVGVQPFAQPRWRGEDLAGRTLLLWGEQGIGDDIFFAHALPALAERAARISLWVDPRLVPIFARSLPANVETFAREGPPPAELRSPAIDFQAPIGDAMRHAYATPSAVPARHGYLRADPARAAELRARYADGARRLIGVSWRSVNPDHGDRKSAPLERWDPILALPGTKFVNLQYGETGAELDAARARTGATIVADATIDQLRDMDGFAAQVAALDAVVSVGNAIAHTAGALGKPLHVLLGTPSLWMWLRGRDDSPFYPSARLHRQARPGDWAAPIAAVAAALRAAGGR